MLLVEGFAAEQEKSGSGSLGTAGSGSVLQTLPFGRAKLGILRKWNL